MNAPRVTDNDRDEITVTLDGREIRGWTYANETERRTKMLAAREFCEGWFQAYVDHVPALIDVLKSWVEEVEGTYPFESLPATRAAIAKAEGR